MRSGTNEVAARPNVSTAIWDLRFAMMCAGFGLSLTTATHAQDRSFDFPSFCTAVDSKEMSPAPLHPDVLYQYQDMLVEAADVRPLDSSDVLNEKIRIFLNANSSSLVCNMVNFNPRNGNVYKLAVARQADDFITDALQHWRVDLNQIDATDGKTVLDYIADRRATAGPTYARTLGRYYDRFRAAGARHASELQHSLGRR